MPPLPKDPRIRQRTNRTPTQATLSAEGTVRLKAPPLPKRLGDDGQEREWHKLTKAFWKDVWRSPMAPEFLQADIHGLYLLVELVDQFWEGPSIALAGEIRLQRQCFGLSPIDRRRLQWEVEKVEQVTRKKRQEGRVPEQVTPQSPVDDPRRLLQVIA